LGLEKSQRSVTHDSLRYINILTYLLTYLHSHTHNQIKHNLDNKQLRQTSNKKYRSDSKGSVFCTRNPMPKVLITKQKVEFHGNTL